MIGHEGENSLLSYLKSEDLATALFAGSDHDLWGLTVLEVSINLTKAGFENYEKVIEATFQYMRRLNEVGPQKYVFNEINDLGKVSFDFESKSEALDTCEMISSRMQLFDNENMPQLLRSREIRE